MAIAHYYFGYVHPFYDGNGRTSRFISSLYLLQELNELTALSLSKGCNLHRRNYLQAFEKTNSVMNRGELTYFCNIFLDILIDSQKNIIVELKENKALLDAFLRVIQNEKRLQNELQESILFILAQNFFFSASEQGMTRKKLSGAAGVSEYKIQKEAGQLIEKGMLAVKGKRPIYYSLNKSFFGLETK